MTNYCNETNMVRVDFFKPSGEWYTSDSMEFGPYTGRIQDAFRDSLRETFQGVLLGMTAVCLEPYHENAYPLMVNMGDL